MDAMRRLCFIVNVNKTNIQLAAFHDAAGSHMVLSNATNIATIINKKLQLTQAL